MNRNIRSLEHTHKKPGVKTVPGLHGSYMQRFLSTAAHKNLESALQQKLNFAYHRHKQVKSPHRSLGNDFYDDDISPHYLNPKEKTNEKKSKKKSPVPSPRSKGKSKETNPFTLPKGNSSAKQVANKETTKPVRETSQGLNTVGKVKEAVGDVAKKSKLKGPNTLLSREAVVDLPKGQIKKIKELPSAQHKDKTKEITGKPTVKKDGQPKSEKKASEMQKKGKSGTVKSKKVVE